MKVLVIGDGMLGSAVADECSTHGHEVFLTSRKSGAEIYFDLFDMTGFENFPQCDWTVITAAVAGYKECEHDPDAYTANVTNTIKLASSMIERGSRILFPSSTAVFNGENAFVAADVPLSPTTAYGRHKAEVETFLYGVSGMAATVRFTKLLDGGCGIAADWIHSLQEGQAVSAFADLTLAPVLLEDAALAVRILMECGANGIYQCSGPEEVSYYLFARAACEIFGFNKDLIREGSCRELPNFFVQDILLWMRPGPKNCSAGSLTALMDLLRG